MRSSVRPRRSPAGARSADIASTTIAPLDPARCLLLLLIATDVVFVLLHVVYANTTLLPSMFALDRERGHAEVFQYIKFYWLVLMMAGLWWRTRAPVYLGWAVLFGFLLLDDALQLHERIGEIIAARWGYRELLGLRGLDFGELTFTAAAGSLLLALVGIGYWYSDREARNASKRVAALIAALAFFGVAVDMLHQMAGTSWIGELLLVVEDGGEMAVVSVACAFAVSLLLHGDSRPARSWLAADSSDARRGSPGRRPAVADTEHQDTPPAPP